MAIQTSIDLYGLTVPNAYIKLGRFVFTTKTNCRAYIEVFSSSDKMGEIQCGAPGVVDFEYDFDSDLSLHAQAYEAAKKLPEFADAIDV